MVAVARTGYIEVDQNETRSSGGRLSRDAPVERRIEDANFGQNDV